MKNTVIAPRTGDAALPHATALVRDADDQEALLRSTSGIVDLDCCFDADNATQRIAESRPAAFIAVRRAGNAPAVDRIIRDLVAERPDVAVLVVMRDPRVRPDFPRDGMVRVAQPIVAQVRAMLRTALSQEQSRAARTDVANLATTWAPEVARDAVRIAIEHGSRRVSVPDFADLNGFSRKALDRYLASGSPMTARELIVWGRLVSIAIALEDQDVTVAAIVPELQFSSPSALRNLLTRHTGLTPSELRQAGGLQEILARLEARLSGAKRSRSSRALDERRTAR